NEADDRAPPPRPLAVTMIGWAWVAAGALMPVAQLIGFLWMREQGSSNALLSLVVGLATYGALAAIPVALCVGLIVATIGGGLLARSDVAWVGALITGVVMTLLVVAGAPPLDRALRGGNGEILGFCGCFPSVPLFAVLGPPTLLLLLGGSPRA